MRKGRLESTKIKQKTRGIDKCSSSVSSILTYVVLKIITNIINVPIFHYYRPGKDNNCETSIEY